MLAEAMAPWAVRLDCSEIAVGSFEAAWGEDGAVCVRCTRIPGMPTLDRLRDICPERLRTDPSECDSTTVWADERVLIMNNSVEGR